MDFLLHRIGLALLPLGILMCNTSAAQQGKVLEATEVKEDLTIDGSLSEGVWKQAKIATGFVQIEPNTGEPSAFDTQVMVTYDHRNLYVGVFCADSAAEKTIRVTDIRRDFGGDGGDYFSIVIDGLNDNRNAIFLGTNPFGAQVDFLSFDNRLRDMDWSGLWKVRTVILKNGWSAEFEIPWTTIRYKKSEGTSQSIGINFSRLRRKTNERSAWSSFPRNLGFTRMEYAGKLTNLQLPVPSAYFRIDPYLATVYNDDAHQKVNVKVGGDLKWNVTSNTVADVTINTDFAQVEADVTVNNTSRLSVRLPEKRQFFLENASFFGSGLTSADTESGTMQVIPFFSRTVGLDSAGRQIRLNAGTRIVHRSLKRSVGLMSMHQSPNSEAPSDLFLVGRYTENLGARSRLGGLASVKSNSHNTNTVVGFDGLLQLGKAHTINGMWVRSMNSARPETGHAGYLQYAVNTNTVIASITETFVSDNFIAEAGFVSRHNVIATSPAVELDLRNLHFPFSKKVRNYQPGIFGHWYHRFTDRILLERQLIFNPIWLNLVNGGFVGLTVIPTYQHIVSSFQPLGVTIEEGEYNYTRYRAEASTDPSRKVSASFRYETGKYYDLYLDQTRYSLALVPSPYVSVRFSWERNRLNNIRDDDDLTVDLCTVTGSFAISPRLQLTGLYQHNTSQNRDILNVRFFWEYKPLSYVYLSWNSRNASNLPTEKAAAFKINYIKQF